MPTARPSPLGAAPPQPPPPRHRRLRAGDPERAGFTFIEILMVVVIFGILVSMAAPRLAGMRAPASMKSAKQKITALTVTARSEAKRRRRPAYLFATRDSMWVVARTGPTTTTRIGSALRITSEFGVVAAVAPRLDSVVYDARGIGFTYHKENPAKPAGGMVKMRLTVGRKADSVCISGVGLVGGCRP